MDITECKGDSCVIHKGKDLKLDADFTANQDTTKIHVSLIASANGLQIPVPGIDSDGCKYVKCPLVKGQKYTLIYDLTVPTILPSIKTVVTAKLIGDHGVLACGSVSGEVKE